MVPTTVSQGVGPQQCTRGARRAACLARGVHSSPPPYASDSSSGSVFLRGAGAYVLGLLIRDKRAPVVI